MKIVNFIQDVPTPHNNSFVKAVENSFKVSFNLWYAMETHSQYDFSPDLAHAIKKAWVYGSKWPSLELLRHAFVRKNEKFLIVGWANPTTRLLILIFFLIRRQYFVWFDCPNDDATKGSLRRLFREVYYVMLRYSNVSVFCAGKSAVDYFLRRGFSSVRLVNLPILIEIPSMQNDNLELERAIRERYAANGKFFVTCGSRLVYEKGYDLLIEALQKIPESIRKNLRVLIVGKGDEKSSLQRLCSEYDLIETVIFEDWMEFRHFTQCVSASDLFVNPARFDAFGGGPLLAMSLGIPVLGSLQAGSCRELIKHGLNGFLYESSNTDHLAEYLIKCHDSRDDLKRMGKQAKTDMELYPTQIVDTFIQNC